MIYGELGEYEKTVTMDGGDYINYYIGEDVYVVTSHVNWCKVYLVEDEYYEIYRGIFRKCSR